MKWIRRKYLKAAQLAPAIRKTPSEPSIRWTMHHPESFTAQEGEHNISVFRSGLGWAWFIEKGTETVDHAFYCTPCPDNELSAKVAAEKAMKRIKAAEEVGIKYHFDKAPPIIVKTAVDPEALKMTIGEAFVIELKKL